MPGFTIHIAVAKQYFKKHRAEIRSEEEFIKGSIAPDLDETMTKKAKDKNKTHYGKWGILPVETNIDQFLEDPKVDINKDYWKGYLIHLLTDYYFYNIVFKEECLIMSKNNDKLFYDYDCLNEELITRYKINILDNIKGNMRVINGEPKYLNKEKVINFIEKISSFSLDEQINIIMQYGMEGLNHEYKN